MPRALCLTSRASPTTIHWWQLAPSSLCPSQAIRQKRVVALRFTGSTSSPEDPWARRILTFPHPRVNSATAAFLTNSSSPVRLLSASFFLKGLCGIAQLPDSSFWSFGGLLQCVPHWRLPWPPPRGRQHGSSYLHSLSFNANPW
jgi:hypothetical protein